MKRIAFLGLLALMVVSCNNENKPPVSTSGADSKEQAPTAAGSDFYKRYSGTLAGQPVVVNLQRIGNKLSGSYYYKNQGKYINLYDYEDSTRNDDYLLTESPFGAASETNAHWNVHIDAKGITGKWTSADGAKQYPVSLTEQYPDGSYRLEISNYEATRTLIEGKEEPAASFTAMYIRPAADLKQADAAFILSVVRKELGCDTISSDIDKCIRTGAEAYLKEYRDGAADMDTSDLLSAMNNYSSDQALHVWYNDNGLLVIENFNAGYYGGAHGNYSSSYICADVAQHRVWKLEDVMTVDSTTLLPLLEIAARDYFGIGLDEKLEDRMLTDEVPVTDNFFISEKGIGFVYNPYEIASFADGTVVLFIPYEKLLPLLQPAFIERMHLSGTTGGAA